MSLVGSMVASGSPGVCHSSAMGLEFLCSANSVQEATHGDTARVRRLQERCREYTIRFQSPELVTQEAPPMEASTPSSTAAA